MKGIMRKIGIGAMALCIVLTGCGTPMAKLTPEEENLIVAYASGSVARNNRYMTQGLTYLREEEQDSQESRPEQDPESEQEEAGDTNPEQDTGLTESQEGGEQEETAFQETTLAEALGQSQASVEYRGYEICKNYLEGDYFALNSKPGMTYLVLHMGIVNTSPEAAECNLLAKNLRGSLYINDALAAYAVETVLPEDFMTFSGVLDGASEVDTVVIFEVPEETAQGIQSLSIGLETDEGAYRIALESNTL